MAFGLIAAVAAIVFVAVVVGRGGGVGGEGRGLLLVTTFDSLRYDVELLVCPGDRVVALTRPGVDPHSYQLRPGDRGLLEEADLIVSTGHAPFEIRLRSLLGSGRLVDVTRLPGIRLLRNPVTGRVDLHMPIYDPGNYRVFMRYLAARLSEANPSCKSTYERRLGTVVGRLEELERRAAGILAGMRAVAATPAVIYAVAWLGLNVSHLLSPEHGLAPTARSLEVAEALLSRGAVAVVMVDSGGKPWGRLNEWLLNTARSRGAPVILVPAPFVGGSILDKLRVVADEAVAIAEGRG